MDTTTEELSPYLYLNNGTHFLLHTSNANNVELQVPELHDAPLLMENGSAWTVGGLPILLNGTLIPDDECIDNTALPLKCQEERLCNENNIQDVPSAQLDLDLDASLSEGLPFSVPSKGFITDEGVFIPSEYLYNYVDDSNKPDESNLAEDGKGCDIQAQDLNNVIFNRIQNKCIKFNEQFAVQKGKISNESRSLLKRSVLKNSNKKVKTKLLHKKQSVNGKSQKSLLKPASQQNVVLDADKQPLEISSAVGPILLASNGENGFSTTLPNNGQTWVISKSEDKISEEAFNLEDIADVVVTYKCKKCQFLTQLSPELIKHWRLTHGANSKDNTAIDVACSPAIDEGAFDNNGAPISLEESMNLTSIATMAQETLNNEASDTSIYLCCSECSLGFTDLLRLKEHMITDHKLSLKEEVNTKETEPGTVNGATRERMEHEAVKATAEMSQEEKPVDVKSTKSFKRAQDISRNARKSRKIKCSVKGCYYKFSRADLLERHQRCHISGEKTHFKCTECMQVFANWMKCSIHLWRCHDLDIDLVSCPICSVYKTNNTASLMHHMKIHGDEKSYKCVECGKCFKQKPQLRNHVLRHKRNDSEDVPNWFSKQQCDICEKIFSDAKCLKKHKQSVHSKLKPFICNVCGHSTAQKATLLMHLRQHTGEKPFSCSVCKFKTGDHNSLRRHMMRHTGSRKYKCPHCKYAAIQVTAYKYHILSKHPGKGGSYHCLFCPFHTVSQESFQHHVADHKNGVIGMTIPNANGPSIEFAGSKNENVLSNSSGLSMQATNIGLTSNELDVEDDDETQNCFLLSDHTEDAVDTGGITIPAGYESDTPLSI